MKLLTTLAVACGLMTALIANAAPDADAAQALLKKSDCFKCHAIDKKKDGPPFKETAKKYKGKADAEDHVGEAHHHQPDDRDRRQEGRAQVDQEQGCRRDQERRAVDSVALGPPIV